MKKVMIFLFLFCASAAQAADREVDAKKLLDMIATEGTPEAMTASKEEVERIRKMLGSAPSRSAVSSPRQAADVFPSPRSNRRLEYR